MDADARNVSDEIDIEAAVIEGAALRRHARLAGGLLPIWPK
jgi:hypothetical protein